MIGPVTNVKAGLIGGATVSFGYLLDFLEQSGEKYTLINTKKYPGGISRLLNPFYILAKVLVNLHKADVIFLNTSQGGTRYLAPLLFVIAKMGGLKFVFRPFGGNIKEYTDAYSPLQKWIFNRTVLRSDILFLQTKALMQHFAMLYAHTIQLPTSREEPDHHLLRGNRPYQRRFVYLGYINAKKGIDQLLEAAAELGPEYSVHLFGPIREERYQDIFDRQKDNYQGILKKEEVAEKLRNYDVLVLPTYYEGEGYPGAIIEAYSIGLPVISTHWKAIPEIVQHGKTGRLIEPRSTAALVEAMRHFDDSNYPDYSQQAQQYFKETFSSQQVTGKAIEQIRSLFISNEPVIKTH